MGNDETSIIKIVLSALVFFTIVHMLSRSKYAHFVALLLLIVVGKEVTSLSTEYIVVISLVTVLASLFNRDERDRESFTMKTADRKVDEDDEEDDEEDKGKGNHEDDEDSEDDEVDIGKTFLEAYRDLSPDQISNMTKETTKLMKTQKQLMGMVKELKPIVEEGQTMMNGFKEYFGNKTFMKHVKQHLPKTLKKHVRNLKK